MSDNWLQFIPDDPNFQPSAEAAKDAEEMLASFVPDAESVHATFHQSIEFFHPGGNWSGVACPACASDIEAWWQDAMQTSGKSRFQDLMVSTPCCAKRISLNDLAYIWPAAFGRFALEAMNPNVKDITPAQEQVLSARLGHRLRKVWLHL